MKIRRVDFSPDEWIAGTVMLTNAERGLYITACALIYSNGGMIPRDQLKAASLDHGNAFGHQLARLLLLGKLSDIGGEISNKRCENELEKARKRAGKAQENGRISGGRPRKINGMGNQTGFPVEKLTINHQPSEEEKTSLTGGSKGTRLPVDFVVPVDWISGGASAREKARLPPVDLATEAVKFCNHWWGQSGQRGVKKDWRATWINWSLNARGVSVNGRKSAHDAETAAFDIVSR